MKYPSELSGVFAFGEKSYKIDQMAAAAGLTGLVTASEEVALRADSKTPPSNPPTPTRNVH